MTPRQETSSDPSENHPSFNTVIAVGFASYKECIEAFITHERARGYKTYSPGGDGRGRYCSLRGQVKDKQRCLWSCNAVQSDVTALWTIEESKAYSHIHPPNTTRPCSRSSSSPLSDLWADENAGADVGYPSPARSEAPEFEYKPAIIAEGGGAALKRLLEEDLGSSESDQTSRYIRKRARPDSRQTNRPETATRMMNVSLFRSGNFLFSISPRLMTIFHLSLPY